MNREKWKSMSVRQKLSWLVDYYSVPFVCTVVAVLVIGFLVYSMLGKNDEDCGLRVMILDDRISSEKCELIDEMLTKELSVNVEVIGYHTFVVEEMQAFAVHTSANDIDLVISPQNEANQLNENGYYSVYGGELLEGSIYESAVFESEALADGAEYIGVVASGENSEAAKDAMDFLKKQDK